MSEEKTSLARDGTMQVTAKEAEVILDGNKPDADAKTRGQDKKLEEIKAEEEPPAKKSKLAKDTTMAVTAKEGKALLAGEKLADTRLETSKGKAKTPLKKNNTIVQTVEEAKVLLDGDVNVTSGRQTRSQSRGDTPKAPLKKANTTQKTPKGKAKKAAKAEEDGAKEEEAA